METKNAWLKYTGEKKAEVFEKGIVNLFQNVKQKENVQMHCIRMQRRQAFVI